MFTRALGIVVGFTLSSHRLLKEISFLLIPVATLVLGLRRSIEKALYQLYHAITDLAASRKLKEDLVIIFHFYLYCQ